MMLFLHNVNHYKTKAFNTTIKCIKHSHHVRGELLAWSNQIHCQISGKLELIQTELFTACYSKVKSWDVHSKPQNTCQT